MSNKNGASRTRRGSTRSLKATQIVARAPDNPGGDAVQMHVDSQGDRGQSSPGANSVPAQAGGGAQCNGEGLDAHGLAENSEGEMARRNRESQTVRGRSPSDTRERGAVQVPIESQECNGRSALLHDIAALQEGQIRRKFCIGLVNKQTNAAKALVRRYCGFDSNIEQDEAARKKINKRAEDLVECVLAGKDLAEEESEIAKNVVVDLDVVAEALAPLLARRAIIEKEMRCAAHALPVYSWAKKVRGLGDLGLAVIVAEAGDLTRYPHVRMLWKRLGLAPYDGKAFSQWRTKGGLSADEWTAAGYAPRRRAEIHACVGEPLLKLQGNAGPYRLVYDQRREATAITHPDWSKAHSHGDAMRIMTKALIADLWSAWRGSKARVDATTDLGPRLFYLAGRSARRGAGKSSARAAARVQEIVKARTGMARADSPQDSVPD